MAVSKSRVMKALLDAQIKIVQAGFSMPEMVISEGAYFAALAASGHVSQTPRPGIRGRVVYGEDFETMVIYPTPEQESSFQLAGPTGMVTVRKAAS